jgi:LysM repeat protein
MKIRYLAYVALVVTMAVWADSAWSAPAPRKAVTHAYVVRTGDGGWWRIAHTHGIAMAQLLAANHATTTTPVRTGQTIQLPASAHETNKRAKPTARKPATPPAKR